MIWLVFGNTKLCFVKKCKKGHFKYVIKRRCRSENMSWKL